MMPEQVSCINIHYIGYVNLDKFIYRFITERSLGNIFNIFSLLIPDKLLARA